LNIQGRGHQPFEEVGIMPEYIPVQLSFAFGTAPVKRCTKCGHTKPVEEFYHCKQAPDGRNWRCRACVYTPHPTIRECRSCEQCGLSFARTARELRKSAGRFCSRACAQTHASAHAGSRRVERCCERCGVRFLVAPARVTTRNDRFCSTSCSAVHVGMVLRDRAPARIIRRPCRVCGTIVGVRAHKAGAAGFYCSRDCLGVDFQRRMRAAYNPNFRHGLAIDSGVYGRYRRALLRENGGSHTDEEWQALCERYGHRCLRCGKNKRLTKDHIVPVALGGGDEIGNIQPLCHNCNAQKNRRIVDYRADPAEEAR